MRVITIVQDTTDLAYAFRLADKARVTIVVPKEGRQ